MRTLITLLTVILFTGVSYAQKAEVKKGEISFENFEEEAIIELYDINGRLIKTYKTSQPRFEINPPSLNSGIYIIKVQTGRFTQTQKLSIIH